MEGEHGSIREERAIREHIYDFYKRLFKKEARQGISIANDAWEFQKKVSDVDNLLLVRPVTMEEIEEVVKSLKSNSAPRPDGFPVFFYKRC